MTEGELILALRARLNVQGGNGPAVALVEQVRDAAGFQARRTLDAISMGLWPSRGLYLTGYELKSSRTDWLRELKNPEKAEAFIVALDFFCIVAAKDVVREDELPDGWGLLVAQKNGLVQKVAPQALRSLAPEDDKRPLPPGFGRSFLATLLRSAVRQHDATPEEVKHAVDAALKREREHADREHRFERERYERLQEAEKAFRKAAGVGLTDWFHKPEDVGSVVRDMLDGRKEMKVLENRLAHLATVGEQIASMAREELEKVRTDGRDTEEG